jgi:hypothetical protein
MIDLVGLAHATNGIEAALRMLLKQNYIISERKAIIYRDKLEEAAAALAEFRQAQKPPKKLGGRVKGGDAE